jgi:hypothetical protein
MTRPRSMRVVGAMLVCMAVLAAQASPAAGLVPTPAVAAVTLTVSPPQITKVFGSSGVGLNGTTSLSFQIYNPNLGTSLTNVGFTDAFPSGLVLTGTGVDGCGGMVTATTTSIALSGGVLSPGSVCLVSGYTVKGTALGQIQNSATVTSSAGTGNTSTANLVVAQAPLSFAGFSTLSNQHIGFVAPGATMDLGVTVENIESLIALTGVGFTGTLPAGLTIANPNGLTTTGACTSGQVSAVAGSHALSLTGVTLPKYNGTPANSSCVIDVHVVAPVSGAQAFTTGPISTNEAGTATAATATLSVVGPGARIYWGNWSGGGNVPETLGFGRLDGSVGARFANTSGPIIGTVVDAAAGRVYYAVDDVNGIRWEALDDSAGGTVGTSAGNYPQGLAINPASGRLYWTGGLENYIAWANPHDATSGVLYQNSAGGAVLDNPTAIAIDPAANRVYWANYGPTHQSISYANLDGTGQGHDVVTTGATVNGPSGIALDVAAGLVYWVNSGANKVSYAHLDGSGGGDVDTTGATFSQPGGMAFDATNNELFWGNFTGNAISYLMLGGGRGILATPGATPDNPIYPSLLYPPQPVAPPSLVGSGKPAVQLSCGKGVWAPDLLGAFLYRVPQTFAYHWQRNGATISGATASTYTPSTTGDYTCTVTAANAAGPTTSAPSAVADSLPPNVGVPTAAPSSGSAIGTSVPVKLTWSGSDAGSGIAHYEIWLSTNGGTYVKLSSPTSATYTRSLTASSTTTYRFRVRAFDNAGNVSGFAYGPTFHVKLVQQTSTSVHWSGSWTTATTTSASGGSYRYASAAGASVSYTFTGRAVGVVATKGTAFGSFKVYLDGVYVGTSSDYATSTLYRRLVYSKAWTSSATHTIKLVCLGTSGHPRIDLDAFVVLA